MAPSDDYDSPWKEVLEVYLEEFLAFCFPIVHAGIAWSANYEWQDRELQLVAPDSERGSQAVDKLVEVRRRDGSDAWVLIHLEVQSQRDRSFAERMYRYHARLYDRHRRPIVSLRFSATRDRTGDRMASAMICGAAPCGLPSRRSSCSTTISRRWWQVRILARR